MSTEAGERIHWLANTLRQAQDPWLDIPTPQGGLQPCVGWKGSTPDTDIAQRLLKSEVIALPLSSLCHGAQRQGVVLGVDLVPKEGIDAAFRRWLVRLKNSPDA